MKNSLKKYAGIIIGAVYALILRLIFNIHALDEAFNLFSVTFIWITPIVIGLIPLFYANKEQLKSWGYRISSPVWTVVVFFLLCFLTRIEDLICLWVILIPYMLAAITVGLIAGEIIQRVKTKRGTLYTIILLPFIISPIEQQFKQPTHSYSVVTNTIINAKPETIWKNIIRVRKIHANEYTKGFFNYAGIPRPLYAELDKDTLGATRIGHFEGGLKFLEKVTTWDRNKHISFDITVVSSSIRQTVFDQHILRGNHFKFLNAEYNLKSLPNGQTELTLSSSYELTTNINAYASFCGDQILTDFQERLLKVIKNRCEN
ncbi:MAG: hypothetical protein KF862_01145 [Chitinophagaceae bacterium]|nr:hypothetical protein [Chitinophagaceae bacterium]